MFEIIPIDTFPPHTHAIHVISGPFVGMKFVFGKIEFMGEDAEGNGRFFFDHTVIRPPDTGGDDPLFDKTSEVLIRTILEAIMKDSDAIFEEEERNNHQSVNSGESDPILQLDEDTTVEIVELSLEG